MCAPLRDDLLVMPAALEMTDRWRAAYGACPPVGYELRGWFPDRCVRFHSLPDSRRYANTEEEYAEILRRERHTLSDGLAGDASTSEPVALVLMSASWSGTAGPTPRTRELSSLLPANYWTSLILDDSDPEYLSWIHLWISRSSLDDPALDEVLRLVADDAARLIVLSDAFSWLYAPYDGGADVIARSTAERDLLRSEHKNWLSAHPSGL